MPPTVPPTMAPAMPGSGRLPARSRRPRLDLTDDQGSLLLAVLLSLLLTSLVAVVAISVLSGLGKSQDARDYAIAQQAADAAVNDALLYANTQHDLGVVTAASPRTGDVGGVRWAWSAVAATDTGVGDGYDLSVRAGSDGAERTFTARLRGFLADSADGSDGHLRYRVAHARAFTSGFFADEEAYLRRGTTVTSYSSTPGAPPATGQGTVASNGTITFEDQAPGESVQRPPARADAVALWDTAALPYGDRCVGLPCEQVATTLEPIRYEVSDRARSNPALGDPSDFIDAHCASPANPLAATRPWTASTDGPLTAGGCYSSLVFDTSSAGSPGGPVYVTGDVVVAPGVAVNATGSAPAATDLVIYAKGENVSIGGARSAAETTSVAWALWAPNAQCTGSPVATGGLVQVHGSMLCRRLVTGHDWRLRYDTGVRGLNVEGDKRAWSLSRYRETYA